MCNGLDKKLGMHMQLLLTRYDDDDDDDDSDGGSDDNDVQGQGGGGAEQVSRFTNALPVSLLSPALKSMKHPLLRTPLPRLAHSWCIVDGVSVHENLMAVHGMRPASEKLDDRPITFLPPSLCSFSSCRCMACDRPLEKLDDRPGPYIPTAQMPLKLPPGLNQGGLNARVPGSTAPSLSGEPSLVRMLSVNYEQL
eukprot:805350-Pelagomonas_calceolata.AAC.4